MKLNRFENVTITFGTQDISDGWNAICACIAESERYQSKERESA